MTNWRLPIGESSIDHEILAAMDDPDYLLYMPVHAGARQVLERLYEHNQIFVLTARPEGTSEATEQWLMNNALPKDRIFNVKEQKKSLYATDVLVDDYLENVREYLRNTNGLALLVDQPWNRDRDDEIQTWINESRLVVVQSLGEAPPIIEREREKALALSPD